MPTLSTNQDFKPAGTIWTLPLLCKPIGGITYHPVDECLGDAQPGQFGGCPEVDVIEYCHQARIFGGNSLFLDFTPQRKQAVVVKHAGQHVVAQFVQPVEQVVTVLDAA